MFSVSHVVSESITEYLGVKEVKFMMLLQVETKQDKFENKVLVCISNVVKDKHYKLVFMHR